MDIKLEPSWKSILKDEFAKPYFEQLVIFLKTEKALGKIIYPAGNHIFNAFSQTKFNDVKVVILGQDPYHGEGQAHGLSFSVQAETTKLPPSLKNIFKEIESDLGVTMPPKMGNLSHWAAQGVLLLNAALTVRKGEPFSHAKFGWEQFTDAVIKNISDKKNEIIFILWGKFAQQKISLIDEGKHYILASPHPSPFSADKGFFGCKHFSKTNEILRKLHKAPIDWKLTK